MKRVCVMLSLVCVLTTVLGASHAAAQQPRDDEGSRSLSDDPMIHETPAKGPYVPSPERLPTTGASGPSIVTFGPYVSVQVNVDEFGGNIPDDAANEPTIAVSATNPDKIVIGWRQFDTVEDDFRQSGYAYSHDGGLTWTFPGSLTPRVFGSDPVMSSDSTGGIYYASINFEEMRLARSFDGGITWDDPLIQILDGFHDKEWMIIDRSGGIGDGHIYLAWSGGAQFTRSTDGGLTFMEPIGAPVSNQFWGTLAVGPDGELYLADRNFGVAISLSARDPNATVEFEITSPADLGGNGGVFGGAPNPGGLLGQTWITTDVSDGLSRGNVYLLSSVDPPGGSDPLNIGFARSLYGGLTWEPSTIVNDDFVLGAWQWFGTMSVAPNGRIDAVWNDTRNTGIGNLSELYYAYSPDAGSTWSTNVRVGPIFDSHLGWAITQQKIGDYYHMVSDDTGANLAYAATYNDEQDVYFLRIGFPDIDTDRDIDLRDFAGFQNCFSGEGGGVSEGCGLFDVDRDSDVDWTDYMGLSNVLVGP